MNRLQKTIVLGASALSLALGTLVGPGLWARVSTQWLGLDYTGHGNWVEPAVTVAEQAARADLVVRARVFSIENRELREVLPYYAADGVTVDGHREHITPFSDVTFEVIETFKGKAEPYLTALQTGGTLVDEKSGVETRFALNDDPIFHKGSEHILFQVDISGDSLHAAGRSLYRVVNPLGRYELAGGRLVKPVAADELSAPVAASLPATEEQLLAEIRRALG